MGNPSDPHFEKIFWFIVALTSFGGFLTVFLIIYLPPEESKRMADTAIVFWLSTAVTGGIGYLLGSSASTRANRTNPNSIITGEGNSSAEINITAHTETKPE